MPKPQLDGGDQALAQLLQGDRVAGATTQAELGSKGPQDPVGALQGECGGRHRIRTWGGGFRNQATKIA